MPEPEAGQSAKTSSPFSLAVVGGGPAGLMAAEVLSAYGHRVHLFEGMPSVGRKFLLAGRGGLNLTHSEAMPGFIERYSVATDALHAALSAFDNEAVRCWADGLGQKTFVGSSNRVFPVGMKASPLLRAWLRRLQETGDRPPVQFYLRHRWVGLDSESWIFDTPQGRKAFQFDGVVLALGGGSWARLGSDGAWVPLLRQLGVDVISLLPSNCGFDLQRPWSEHFRSRFAGTPIKSVVLSVPPVSEATQNEACFRRKGEFVVTDTGVEGSLIYAASSILRLNLIEGGVAHALLDLLPDRSAERVLHEVSKPRGSRSLSTHLKSRLGLDGIKMGLLYEMLDASVLTDPASLSAAIKALPLVLGATRPLDEAISSAGGVAWDAIGSQGMLKALPGVFCAGEMLDWDAPTGGYLLTACMALGRKAGEDLNSYLQAERSDRAGAISV